jgi:deoxyribonucleoside regulator
MIKVAEMYYYQRLPQKSVAERLGISVPTVSRILNEAVDSGLIKVEIVDKQKSIGGLAERISRRFGLVRAIVIGSPAVSDQDFAKKLLGKAACGAFLKSVKPGDLVGMGPGGTMLEFVESLGPELRLPGVTLVPLMGGWGHGGVAYEVNKLLSVAAASLHCDFHFMPCPALVSSEDLRTALLGEPLIAESAKLWNEVNVAVFSIGGELDGGNYPQLRGNETMVAVAREAGAVGDLLGRFIDAQGAALDIEVNRKIVSIPSDAFARIPLRIGIGGGSSKIRAVLGALRGGLVNVLVSDEDTCETILTMEDEGHE